MIYWVHALLFFSISFLTGLSAKPVPIENGPVHEAIATIINANLILEAISTAPPKNIIERIPAQEISNANWISGYWAWSRRLNDYVWVSGVWRVAPPGQQWIDGYWEKFEDGWVWINGFWSSKPLDQINFIKQALPTTPAETIMAAPGEDYFCVPGYWSYEPQDKSFVWVGGGWQPFNPDWVLVPAHYVWRHDGYIFIEAFWDWPLEQRGQPFTAMEINPMEGVDLIFQPYAKASFEQVLVKLLSYYPNHICLFSHHCRYNPDFWKQFWGTPPWWNWQSWWCLPWEQQWAVWWWYCHPGYSQPLWMTKEIAAFIPPPTEQLVQWVKQVVPPVIVTARGVLKAGQVIQALKDLPGNNNYPIIPSNKAVKEIFIENLAKQPQKPNSLLKPQGTAIVKIPPAAVLNPIKGEPPKQVKTLKLPEIPELSRASDNSDNKLSI